MKVQQNMLTAVQVVLMFTPEFVKHTCVHKALEGREKNLISPGESHAQGG